MANRSVGGLAAMTRAGMPSPENIAERTEFTNRSMCRLMATARYGDQPQEADAFQVKVRGAKTGKWVSVAFRQRDTEAVLSEIEVGAACGNCGHNPCEWRQRDEAVS